MSKNHFKFCTYALFLFNLSTASAQEATVGAGGDAVSGGGSVAYSVGQVVYTSNTGVGGSSSQGVQQPYEIYVLGIKNTKVDVSLSIFPNPTVDNLTLEIKGFNQEKLSYQVFDMQGKLLETQKITAAQTQINTSLLPSASYILSITEENNSVQSFKIIKN